MENEKAHYQERLRKQWASYWWLPISNIYFWLSSMEQAVSSGVLCFYRTSSTDWCLLKWCMPWVEATLFILKRFCQKAILFCRSAQGRRVQSEKPSILTSWTSWNYVAQETVMSTMELVFTSRGNNDWMWVDCNVWLLEHARIFEIRVYVSIFGR